KAAFVISLVGAVFSIINAIPFFITGYKMQVIHGLIIGILMVCSVVILFSGILYNPRSDDEKHMRNVIIAYGVIICIYSAVLTFFWSIIFRSYRYMVENY
uniref:Uncharacterized protein n=1 Tax=Ditylenchus dipsaci TaxID=166011 RepID=A0A915DRH8_9BILA